MKTQISKNSFRPAERFSGVYQQQGRMFTDYDFNELVDLVKVRLAEALTDAIASGAPRDRGAKIVNRKTAQAGWLYAGGRPGLLVSESGQFFKTFPLDSQADFPGATIPGPDTRIYADLWERTITSLEDGQLVDPGLHGADTCSRTRTMVQIKFCSNKLDPENAAHNPEIGNAPLRIVLRQGVTLEDPCDPCADNVDLDSRVGNYLFRLEVHHVAGRALEPDEIILKWSRENGAESHPVDEEPESFKSDKWVYEFFDVKSETHLGHHLAASFTPERGELKAGWPPEPLPAFPGVRRWDGSCRLTHTGNGWQLEAEADGSPSRDRDKVLSMAAPGEEDEYGKVTIGSTFRVNLEHVVLKLTLQNRTFLAGDYWQVPVRQAVHKAGNTLETALPPAGIRHHYLHLASIDHTGSLTDQTDADRRRLEFPPLTDLHAVDIAIEKDKCPKLYASAENLQQALDNLCDISAADIAFTDKCKKLFAGANNLQMALDNLCAIEASDIAFRPETSCALLQDANTVKEALDTLCKRPLGGGGCRITVGKGGTIPELQSGLLALLSQEMTNICLCLLPGEHRIGDLKFNGTEKFNISMVGCGPGVVVRVKSFLHFLELSSLHLEGLNFQCDQTGRVIVGKCGQVRIEACRFEGTGSIPLLELHASGATHLSKTHFESGSITNPGPAMMLLSGGQDVTLEDNQILGVLSLEGNPGQLLKLDKLENLRKLINTEAIKFTKADGRLCARGNRFARVDLGDELIKAILKLIENESGNLQIEVFSALMFTDNIFISGTNQILAKHCRLNTTFFEVPPNSERVVGAVIGMTGLYSGNHCNKDRSIYNVTGSSETNARIEMNDINIQDTW